MRVASCSSSFVSRSVKKQPRKASNNGNQSLDIQAEAPRSAGEEVRRPAPAAQEGKELRSAGQAPARQLADTQPSALSAHRPKPGQSAKVQDQPHHAP